MPRALYLHVPFCPVVCPYCDFHKMRRHEGLVARYLDRLEEEAEAWHERHPGPLDTVYFGGGTPSHLADHEPRCSADLIRGEEITHGARRPDRAGRRNAGSNAARL